LHVVDEAVHSCTFGELSDPARERAREWYRQLEAAVTYEDVYADAQRFGTVLGIDLNRHQTQRRLPAIYWNGFWSQGDGACFEGEYAYAKIAGTRIREVAPRETELHRIADKLQALQRPLFYGLTARVTHRGRYYHEYSTHIAVDAPEHISDDRFAAAEEAVSELLREFMRWIYRQLEEEYSAAMQDSAVDEAIIAGGYRFADDGRWFP
jgi:hypothetical protein